DAASNTGSSGGKAITIDTTAPSVTLTKVNGNTVSFPLVTNASLTSVGGACGTASRDSTTINPTITRPAHPSRSASCSSGAWRYTISPALTAERCSATTVSRSDAAGNTGSSGGKSITIDTTAPTVTLTKVNGNTVSFPFSTNANVTSVGGACGT